ncbi:allatostatin-A receptor-like [Ptychodera flava]|uniref:allatostatin-A receptor-like n=1 Tax=Ptychodera flava TaxID=63121 RepID=UPI00396A1EFF
MDRNASNDTIGSEAAVDQDTGPEWSYVQTTEMIIATIGIVSNFVVILAVLGTSSLRAKLTYKLTVCLAVADFISCVFLIPRSLRGFFPVPNGIGGEIYCRTSKATVLWVSLVASTYSLLAITGERFFAIVYPIAYSARKDNVPAWLIVGAVWLLAFIMQSFNVYNNSYDAAQQNCKYQWPFGEGYQTFAGIGLFFSTYFIPLVFLSAAYYKMLKVLRQNQRRVGSETTSSQPGATKLRARKRVVKMFLVVFLAFAIFWAPNQFLFLIQNFGFRLSSNSATYNFTRIFAGCNSCVNPFIYAVWSRPFRDGIRSIFCRNHSGGDGSDTQTTSNVGQA